MKQASEKTRGRPPKKPAAGPGTPIQRVRQQSRQLVRELDIVRSEYLNTGYTFMQCHVLFELSVHPSNLMELSERLLLDKSNTSRTLRKLVDSGLVKKESVAADQRQKLFSLTAQGKQVVSAASSVANQQVGKALALLNEDEQATVIAGLELYNKALRKSRMQADFEIRPIRKSDNAQVARIIRTVMTEFQAVGDGYSIDDPEVSSMFESYRDSQSCYLVIEGIAGLQGCGGIGPLKGGDRKTCELQKMFFMPELRGIGLGQRLLTRLLDEARKRKYTRCYLETLDRMWGANQLYQKCGFRPLDKPQGSTGHNACDRWYLLDL